VPIKLALPKGRLLRKTASLLQKAGWRLDEYHSDMGFYRPRSETYPQVLIRVFHEKDIPVQIAAGNYDLGICCLDWIEELMAKYPRSGLVKVKDLSYGEGCLYMASASPSPDITRRGSLVRIAGEYPNLAESFALRNRLRRFSIFPLWGAAEVYPPENADMVLLPARSEGELSKADMKPLSCELEFSAFLIANRDSLESKKLDKVINSICDGLPETPDKKAAAKTETRQVSVSTSGSAGDSKNIVRLALPDGHQQPPTLEFLNKAGIRVDDYPSTTNNRRPGINIDGVSVKVVRPQDMPLQVANGNFDLAITGRDWLTEHLVQFPPSPVRELLDLRFSRVRLVAVVSRELAVGDAAGLSRYLSGNGSSLRVASEYVNLADRYARENHLGHYRVIPTWGATEAFLPEDADLLIENTETGRTIARHNLKIIDTLFVSTACLIGNKSVAPDSAKGKRIQELVKKMQKAVGDG
jgi:ATP phosphoribosyltransferase